MTKIASRGGGSCLKADFNAGLMWTCLQATHVRASVISQYSPRWEAKNLLPRPSLSRFVHSIMQQDDTIPNFHSVNIFFKNFGYRYCAGAEGRKLQYHYPARENMFNRKARKKIKFYRRFRIRNKVFWGELRCCCLVGDRAFDRRLLTTLQEKMLSFTSTQFWLLEHVKFCHRILLK